MRRLSIVMLIMALFLVGCNSGDKQGVENAIKDAFEARAKAVFRHEDKKPLAQYFGSEALDQTKSFLEWSPTGGWDNVKDIKYSINLRIDNVKMINGKQAGAVVYETAVVSWDWIDPRKARAFKDDAWSNRKHALILAQNPEGKWIIEQDNITK